MRIAVGCYLLCIGAVWVIGQFLLIVDSMKTGNDYWNPEIEKDWF